ncbi:lipopolysaccharide biosynthesis protein [Methylobacterium sp. WL12]|uniref:GumC family protein n=1 Tax=Methylobacterium sp. WL12 TaxID=2603890 RepID=UPI0011CA0D3B|nr:polysaccharide biosynthesis tyrosine autokinase [Methylobacterium sp. WL12]TXM75394.1 lipopolysaccharide biosynthesis protein [Methylobacterium sp. WL12]
MTTSYLSPIQTAGPAPARAAENGQGAGQGAGQATNQAAGLVAAILRRRGLFAAVFASVMAVAILLLMAAPTQYLAVGSVIVAEPEPGSNNPNASVAWIQKLGDPADIESQMLVIRSPRIMRLVASGDVVEKVVAECRQSARGGLLAGLMPQRDDGCDRLRGNADLVVDTLQRRFVVTGAGRSRVINIAYRSPNAETAQALTNALITTFLDDQRGVLANSREAATEWLWKEVRQLDASLRADEAKIQAFRRSKGLMSGANAPITSERLSTITQQLAAAETAKADAAARLAEINADQARGSIDAPAVLASRTIGDLKQQMNVVAAQIANTGTVLGPNHPTLQAMRTELAGLKLRVEREVASIGAGLKKTYDASSALAKSLRQQMEGARTDAAAAMENESVAAGMVRNAEIKRGQYADLYKRANELETERRILVGSTRLVSLADVPAAPVTPKPPLYLGAGFVLAAALAAAAALLRDRADRSVRTSTQVAAVAHAPVFAQLPHLRAAGGTARLGRIGAAGADLPLAAALRDARADPLMQQVLRNLGARLMLAGTDGRSRAILLTSGAPGEGKSFTTLALAQLNAGSGRRVLVIEGDLRRPVFEAALDLPAGPGLAGILRGEALPREAVIATATQNLDAIPAGTPTTDSTELLMGARMTELLVWARKYDLVLIDSPPAAILMDAQILARQVDGVLCCTRWGRSQVSAISATVAGLREAGGDVFGLAITMVRPDDHPFYDTGHEPARRYLGAA